MRCRWWLFVGCWMLLMSACWQTQEPISAGELRTQRRAMIYGADDRKDVVDHPDDKLRGLADAVGMLVLRSNIGIDGSTGLITLKKVSFTNHVRSLKDYGNKPLCDDEPFRLDPQAGGCTVFLVGPRKVVTAGHCITEDDPEGWCQKYSIVFGYYRAKDGSIRDITPDDVYPCADILRRTQTPLPNAIDVGIIALDRDVKGRTPMALDTSPQLKDGDPLATIGHPHGILMKIAAGGKVSSARASSGDYFVTNLDTYPGNSGSPVISLDTYKVVGIHVRGARPVFVTDTAKGCNRSATRAEDKGGQSATYITHAKEKPCSSASDCSLNEACLQQYCRPRSPDIRVTRLDISPQSPRIGDTLTVTFTLQNGGAVPVRIPFYVGLWRSANADLDPTGKADVQLAFDKTTALAAGKTVQGSFSIKVQDPLTVGRQYIGIFADDRTTDKAISNQGLIPESSEANNSAVIVVDIKPCAGDCTTLGGTRCDGQQILRCQRDALGCLRWEKDTRCAAPKSCVEGACIINCQHTCDLIGKRRCQGSNVQLCKAQSSGCRQWQAETSCKATQSCQDGACTDPPTPTKALDQPCSGNDECISDLCAGEGNARTCQRPCSVHDDCKDLQGRAFCLEGRCAPIPRDACISDARHNCTRFGSRCVQDRCVPPKGCGCDASSQEAPGLPAALLLLLLLGWRLLQKPRSTSMSPRENG